MITIRFSGRMPSPREIPIGQETDQAAEKLRFRLPEIAPGQIATLQLIYPDGTSPDAIAIEDGVLTVPASLTEQAGRCRAWVEILADNSVAWHSELFYLDVGELPPISEETERAFPTAFQQAIAATLGNKQAAETAAQEAEIAAAIAQSAQGSIAVEINGDGDLIVTYEDTEGETHEANLGPVSAYSVAKKYGYQGTEAEWEQNVASVGVNAAAAAESAEDAADSAEAAATAKTAAQAAQTAAETAAERDVTAWLDEHAQTAQVAVIDNTLTIQGAAAEAKVTGDKLGQLKSAINSSLASVLDTWSYGTYMAETGLPQDQYTNRARTNTSLTPDEFALFICDDAYEFTVYAWDKNSGTYVGNLHTDNTFSKIGTTKWVKIFYASDFPSDYQYRIAARNASDPTSDVNLTDVANKIKIILNLSGYPALVDTVNEHTDEIDALGNKLDEEFSQISSQIGIIYTEWEQGTYRAEDGSADDAPQTRARLSVFVPADNYIITCSAAYEFLVYAWNKNSEAYVGALRTDDTFKKNGTAKWVQEFVITGYDDYKFKLAVRDKANPSQTIDPQTAGENVFFILNFHQMDDDITRLKNANKRNYTFSEKAETLAINTELICCNHMDNKKNDVMAFKCGINSSFQSVIVGHGYNITYGDYIKVTRTSVIVYNNNAVYNTYAHGMTLTDFMYCEIIHGIYADAKIRVYTNGGSYEIDDVPWRASRGNVFAMSTDNALTNCELTITFGDLLNDIFVFGDSYVSIGDTERWTYYLIHNGYTKNMIFGYGGAKSADELACFKNAIEKATPKYCVWCLGMNDADSSTEMNANFKSAIDEFISLCEYNHITPILATIPCCPVKNNAFKNAYVKSLGYRYIDFAKAVNAETAGSTWYTGMIANDNEHPNANGAKALYTQALIDFPEISLT